MEFNAAGVCANGDKEELDTLALELGHHITLELDSQLHGVGKRAVVNDTAT
jgi:hypothetical protein